MNDVTRKGDGTVAGTRLEHKTNENAHTGERSDDERAFDMLCERIMARVTARVAARVASQAAETRARETAAAIEELRVLAHDRQVDATACRRTLAQIHKLVTDPTATLTGLGEWTGAPVDVLVAAQQLVDGLLVLHARADHLVRGQPPRVDEEAIRFDESKLGKLIQLALDLRDGEDMTDLQRRAGELLEGEPGAERFVLITN